MSAPVTKPADGPATDSHLSSEGFVPSERHVPTGADGPTTRLPTFYSISEVGELFDRNERSIRRWISKGDLRSIKVGGSVFVPAEALLDLISAGIEGATLAAASRRKKA